MVLNQCLNPFRKQSLSDFSARCLNVLCLAPWETQGRTRHFIFPLKLVIQRQVPMTNHVKLEKSIFQHSHYLFSFSFSPCFRPVALGTMLTPQWGPCLSLASISSALDRVFLIRSFSSLTRTSKQTKLSYLTKSQSLWAWEMLV